jgi:glycosyltransferase A (GT-A) superfamily protein (DUF2064 family)
MANLIRPQRARQYKPATRRTSLTISLNDVQLADVQAVMLEQTLGKSGAIQWIVDDWRRIKQGEA